MLIYKNMLKRILKSRATNTLVSAGHMAPLPVEFVGQKPRETVECTPFKALLTVDSPPLKAFITIEGPGLKAVPDSNAAAQAFLKFLHGAPTLALETWESRR